MTLILFVTVSTGFAVTNPIDVEWNGEAKTVSPGQEFDLSVTINIPEGIYIYADETELEFKVLDGLLVQKINYPKPSRKADQQRGKTTEVFEGKTVITVKGKVPSDASAGERELFAVVKYRGCSSKLCFRPEERDVSFILRVDGVVANDGPVSPTAKLDAPNADPSDDKLSLKELIFGGNFAALTQRGVLFTVFVVFLAGLLTSLTPCVWPVIPAILVFVGVHPEKKFLKNLGLASSLVLGLVLVYSILSIVAVAFGKNLGFLYQWKWFSLLVVIFFVAMSLSMFGLFEIRLPHRWHHKLHKLGGEGFIGAFCAGMGLGLMASPCAGPVIAGLLGYIAIKNDYLYGFAMVAVYSLGFGVLFIILGSFYGELVGKIKNGPWLLWVKRILGVVLLLPALFYAQGLLSIDLGGNGRAKVEWIREEKEALKFAFLSKRPVMVEFTADWCPPCKRIESNFFSREDVVKLSYQLVPLRVDASFENKEIRDILNRYDVYGMPAFVFLDPSGKEYKDLRVTEPDPATIEKAMREAIARSSGEIKKGVK